MGTRMIKGIVFASVITLSATLLNTELSSRADETEVPEVTVVTQEAETEDYEEVITYGYEDTYISDEIRAACIEIGNECGYCPELLMAIIEAESSGRQYAENGSCKGLMQINTANEDVIEYMEENGYTDIFDIYTNIRLGCYVLDQKREVYGDDLYAVLMGYNGVSNVWKKIESGEISEYAIKVSERSAELERTHGK